MRGDKPFLHIHARAHLGGGTKKDANAASIHVAEQLCFSHIRVGVMDEGNFLGGNALRHELLLHVVIYGELAGCGNDFIHIDDAEGFVLVFLFRRFPDRSAVHVDKRPGFQILPFSLRGCLSLSALGRGQVTEDKLRALVGGSFTPDFMNTFNSGIELGPFKIISGRLYQPVVQSRLASVIGNLERIVPARVRRQILHAMNNAVHVPGLGIGAFHHVIERFAALNRRCQGAFPGLLRLLVQIAFGHDIGKGTVHGKQFRYILELGKAAFQRVVHPCGVQLPAGRHLSKCGRPGIKVFNIFVFQFVILHIALQGIYFGNGIADGRTRHEVYAAPIVLSLQITALDEQIEGLG